MKLIATRQTAMIPRLLITLVLLTWRLIAAETLVYKNTGDREMELHIEKPADWKATDQRPAVVFFFGGGWVGGTPEQFRPQSEYFAGRGIVGLRVEYRTIPKGDKGPPLVCCADAKSAMRYVRGHAAELGVDPTRIAAAGGSAGGHLAAFTALVDGLDDPGDDTKISCRPDALVLFNPVFNNGPGQWGYERVGERFRDFSPAHHVSNAAPPTCVFLGDADKLIPVMVLREFEAAMKVAGVRCDAHVYPGAGHGFFNKEPHKSQTLAEADKFLVSLGWLKSAAVSPPAAVPTKPNILLILADDLGYGDVSCYNDKSKVATSHIDRLAREGMRFTDAHSPATVCTPSRYSLMTGQMAFRVPNGDRVFESIGGPSLIAPGRLTLPSMLRANGYATACVGKWHVGLTFFDKEGQPVRGHGVEAVQRVDFSRRIEGGPVDHGFDHFFGTACCPTTDWLYAFIENDRVPVPPAGPLDKSKLPKHPYANDCRAGLIAPDFPMEEVDLVFLKKSREFLEQHVRQSPGKPFFLYHAAQGVHLPSFAAPQFKGKTLAGPHGDFIHQLDWVVGELMQTLEKLGIADNTLVIFTSDNGPETTSVIHMRADHDHDGARPWRGVKRDDWEGGHRVPFIVRWPGKIKPATTSAQLTSLTDVVATVAAIIGTDLPDHAAEDSFNLLPAWRGEDKAPIRPYLLTQAFNGARTLSIRRGPLKYLDHPGSGGNRYENDPGLKPFILPDTAPAQLYNLEADPGETKNLHAGNPSLVKELKTLLEESRTSGRSRPTR